MSPSSSARNVGVIFDSDLNFCQLISQTCRSWCCTIYVIYVAYTDICLVIWQRRLMIDLSIIAFRALTFYEPSCYRYILRSLLEQLRSTTPNYFFFHVWKNEEWIKGFSVAASTLWNSLPFAIRTSDTMTYLWQLLKSIFGLGPWWTDNLMTTSFSEMISILIRS